MTDGQERGADVRGWVAWFVIATLGTVALILLYSSTPLPTALASASAVVSVQVLYFAIARPDQAGIRRDGWRAWTWSVVAVVGLGVAVGFDPWAAASLFALTPQVVLLLSTVGATVMIIALNAVSLGVQLSVATLAVDGVVQAIGTSAFVVVFSVFLTSRMREIALRSEERRRLIDELRAREAEVAALSAARGAAQERTRIAREMHDTLAQGFTSIVTLGNAVLGELEADPEGARRHVELITATARENLAESRRIIAALAPAALDGTTLEAAVTRVVQAFEAETGVRATVDVETSVVAPATAVVALRVIQESLANVRRHADASRVSVRVTVVKGDGDAAAPGLVAVTVADDGRGFVPDAPTDGYGLSGMRGRVEEAGGSIEVRSSAGAGTTVIAALPLSTAAPEVEESA